MDKVKLNTKDKVLLLVILILGLATMINFKVIDLEFASFLEGNEGVEVAGLRRMIRIILISNFLIITAVISFIITNFFKQTEKGLEKIKSGLQRLANGDLVSKIDTEQENRFEEVYIAFNDLLEQQSLLIKDVLEETENLSLYSEIQSASTEAGDQAIETTNELIEGMSASIEEISASSEEVTSFAEESTAQTQIGKENMEDSVEIMEEISDKVGNTVSLVEELNNNTEEIGSIIELITNVADQTNLLALNAAIEAARASNEDGNQGHGFTVVAEEIRELAEETTKATVEIKELIDNTRSNSKKVIKSIKEVEEKTLQGQQITEESNRLFFQIEEATDETAVQIEQIAYAAQDLAQHSQGLMETADDIGDMSKEIKDSSQGLEDKVKKVKKILGQFDLGDQVLANEWSSKYEIGIEKVDEQHRGIFEKANYLLEVYKKQQSGEEIGEVLDFLQEYIEQHFNDEEEIQRSYGYPEYEEHKKLHDAFKSTVGEVITEYKQSNNITSLMKLNKMAIGWLLEHIKKEDQKLAQYIKKN
ncbi:bacteriohemerythrin [Natroniella sulfidigena]|uniref:bacteriohemerythrin n=1 Tax=Natroniella sulfidigena TaxID=723921 RepID=UPI00200A736A|nr:bacteriohemerythrin [Natroniella sulfidigena]MCK8815779.1 bacteriohemerythrin [Natroniella sulfidigena]